MSENSAEPCEEDIIRLVQKQKLVLEGCHLYPEANLVTGSVRVLNLAYEKRVVIRYTLDNWDTFQDLTAGTYRSE